MAADSYHLIIEIALDLANSINNADRFDRLLNSIRKAIQSDAVALMGFHNGLLTPLATQGLASGVMGRRFKVSEHPRLSRLCGSLKPYVFSDDCELPDPYDGLLISREGELPVHSCMGLPLYSDQELIGLVTVDSLTPKAFECIDFKTLELITALSAATLKTAFEFKKLEYSARHAQEIVEELTKEALLRDGGELIGQSLMMQRLKNSIELVADSDFTVLITGETGVGKELVARKIHQLSDRKHAPLVYLNCASLPESLAETELFGHTKGAFTGASRARAGKFQLANGGTLFLDEVGELSISTQSKLLRALQSGEIQPVGQDEVEHVDVRIIAATNRDLEAEIKKEQFRADLYHRLSVYPLKVPSLRERGHDVLLLAGYFLEKLSRQLNMRQLTMSSDAKAALLAYSWPGNVRELEHVISRASLKTRADSNKHGIASLSAEILELGDGNHITEENEPIPSLSDSVHELKLATELFQKQHILKAVEQASGNWSQAARLLGMDRSNLTRLAKRLGINIKRSVSIEH